MKKKILFVMLVLCMLIPYGSNINATDFSGKEDYYRNLCSSEGADATLCNQFRKYLNEKANDIQNQLNEMDNELKAAKNNISELGKKIKGYQGQIDQLEASIQESKNVIANIQNTIASLDAKILETKEKIDARNNQIKKRMIAEQPLIGTNMYFDFIMGSKDLLDLVRTMDGIKEITKNDNAQIKLMKQDKKKMDDMKSEQVRLEKDQEEIMKQDEISKQIAAEMKAKTQVYINEYQAKQANIEEKMRSAQVSINDVLAFMPNSGGISGDVSNNGWIRPIQGAYISAGTWYYPASFGGGVHLGVDYAVGAGTPIRAPADSFVMYANNPCSSYGYLGNGCGFPWGGGNDISLLTSVNGVTYALTFFHMMQNNFYAKGRTQFAQGEIMGMVGSSGNSSGAHSHIEVIRLNMSVQEAAAVFSQRYDFAYGTGWNTPGACSQYGCRLQPETVFP
ncbi:MAG: peptidoglycan DD-metalloendopeptidase family protein [Erysipelotrichaceae bacterium]